MGNQGELGTLGAATRPWVSRSCSARPTKHQSRRRTTHRPRPRDPSPTPPPAFPTCAAGPPRPCSRASADPNFYRRTPEPTPRVNPAQVPNRCAFQIRWWVDVDVYWPIVGWTMLDYLGLCFVMLLGTLVDAWFMMVPTVVHKLLEWSRLLMAIQGLVVGRCNKLITLKQCLIIRMESYAV